MKKYLLLLILILVFSVSFIIGQADPDTVTLSDPTEDGTAEEWYDDAKDGHLYHSSTTFPEVGTGKEIDLGSNADGDLQIQLSLGWFAIGLSSDEGVVEDNAIYSEEYAEVNPPPTLYVEYSVPAEVNVIFFSTPF